MEKQKFVVKLSSEDSKFLQKKQYEFNAKASIVSVLAQDKAISWDAIQDEIAEAEVASKELDSIKSELSYKAVQESGEDIDTQYFSWRLDYYDDTITFVQEVKIPEVFSCKVVEVEEADVKAVEKMQYEFNAATNIMRFLKESNDINPEIVKEYNKILTQRKIDLDVLKDEVVHKYNKDNLDLTKHDWSIDFNTKTLTFKEVQK